MILFSKMRYQNLLATGNNFIEIDFVKAKSTLIVGNNGAGKSTMLEALTYGLFGRAYRAINLPQLINSMTGKGLLVELEFTIGSKSYVIKRGMKPNIFKIYIDGVERKSEGPKEDQKYLEEIILKLNFKSFCQIIVLGSANYIPFMELSAGDRRKVVENLLDIQIFTIMNSLLKTRSDSLTEEMRDLDREIDLCENKIEIEQKHLASLRQDNTILIEQKQEQIHKHNAARDECSEVITSIQTQVNELFKEVEDAVKLQTTRTKLLQFEASINEKIKKYKSEITFFESHDDCPTCKQGIDHDFKASAISKHSLKTKELGSAMGSLDNELREVENRITRMNDTQKSISNLQNEIAVNNQKIRSGNVYINELQEEIDKLKEKAESLDSSDSTIKALTNTLKSHKTEMERLHSNKAVQIVAGKLLKDTGIKTKIINQYIPVMNTLINKYLGKMELFVEFNLDDSFNETIKSRYRDTYSFASFSEGEKMRISLAILFTWRAISKMRNSASTNILIMDEVLDSSLDLQGTDEFLTIIEELTSDSNIFVISHKGDPLYDRFENVIRFEKNGNFSHIVETIT